MNETLIKFLNTGRKVLSMGRDNKTIIIMMLITMLWITTVAAVQVNPNIICQNGSLSVDAVKVHPEALFAELGKQCNMEVSLRGNTLANEEITIHFENLPVKEGVKKLVKACSFKNYLIDFQEGSKKSAKLVLLSEGTGQKILNKEVETQGPSQPPVVPQMQEFPEYAGKLPYDKSQADWDDEAKTFSYKIMNTIPPAARDAVAKDITEECNEVAREKDAKKITQEIVKEAWQRLGEKHNMPPSPAGRNAKTSLYHE
jgi:cell division protein YceG involved in septum cleavage